MELEEFLDAFLEAIVEVTEAHEDETDGDEAEDAAKGVESHDVDGDNVDDRCR